MTRKHSRPSPIAVGLSFVAAGALGLIVLSVGTEPVATQQSNFMGGSPSVLEHEMTTLRLRFPAGSRSNWHSHSDGQLLMLEEGRGLTQERGGPIREVGPGEPWYTPAGVEHWHGAAPDEDAVQWTIYGGPVEWLEPVRDPEYLAPAGG